MSTIRRLELYIYIIQYNNMQIYHSCQQLKHCVLRGAVLSNGSQSREVSTKEPFAMMIYDEVNMFVLHVSF